MFGRTMLIGAILATMVLALGGAAQADFLAGFDVNAQGGPTQSGYAAISVLDSGDGVDVSATQNGITATVGTCVGSLARDRSASGPLVGHPLADLLRDMVMQGYANDPKLSVELTGLAANTAYNLRWYHYENGDPDTYVTGLRGYKDSIAPANLLFESPYTGFGRDTDPDVTGWNDFQTTSDGTGRIFVVAGPHTLAGGVPDLFIPYLNGFEVVSVVPEPSTFSLLAAGLLSLLAYAWRRRR